MPRASGGIWKRLNGPISETLLNFARDLSGQNSIKAISERVVQRLDTLIGGNSTVVVLNARKVDAPHVLAENIGPEYQRLMPVIWALRHDHPGFRYHRAYAARAVALSDLIPLHQWKKTKLYNEVYSKMGMHEQMMGVLPYARPDLCGVVVNRTRRTFTERDRSVLNVARFHISEASRKAKMCAAIPSPELTRAFEPLVGGSIVVLNTTGAVQFCSELAQTYFETFFSAERPFNGELPPTVARWVRREITAFETDDLAVRTPQPLNVLRGERNLHIRLAGASTKTAYFLVLRAEDPTLQLKKFSSLGLGPRATEVLYWIAKGKTNGEIGTILGVRPRTIEKHVEGILAKLGVENRVTAALVATQAGL
jgi:DNA-binding CsgD family transcriptional regulator